MTCSGPDPKAGCPHPLMRRIYGTDEVLHKEFDEISARRNRADVAWEAPPNSAQADVATRANDLKLTALCLSGGGVRSAAFCLGILQALARKRLLNDFDYLSTVSGGGFAGGWLLAQLNRPSNKGKLPDDILAPSAPADRARQARALRELQGRAAHLGALGGGLSDGRWAAFALGTRNVLLNWLAFAPCWLILVLLPIIYRTWLAWFENTRWFATGSLVIATLSLTFATCACCQLVPTHRLHPPQSNRSRREETYRILIRVIAPAMTWAFCAPIAVNYGMVESGHILAWRDHLSLMLIWPFVQFVVVSKETLLHILPPAAHLFPPPGIDVLFPSFNVNSLSGSWPLVVQLVVPVFYAVAAIGGYVLAWVVNATDNSKHFYGPNFGRWLLATLAASIVLWTGLCLVRPEGYLARYYTVPPCGFDKTYSTLLVNPGTATATLLPPFFIFAYLLQTSFYVALRKRAWYQDLDRQWLARASGLAMQVGVGWAVLSMCSLLAVPDFHFVMVSDWSSTKLAGVAGATTLVGSIAANIAKRMENGIEKMVVGSAPWTAWVLVLFSLTFAILLLIASSVVLGDLLGIVQAHLFGVPQCTPVNWHPIVIQVVLLVLLVVWLVCGNRMGLHRFSMHAVYRQRLSRAFLGQDLSDRRSGSPNGTSPVFDPFTGFASDDNPRLATFACTQGPQRLYPVINLTANLAPLGNREGPYEPVDTIGPVASFIATPLFCGLAGLPNSEENPRPRQAEIKAGPAGAFVPTRYFGGKDSRNEMRVETSATCCSPRGAYLGSMLTISGAAVSPAWGYHGSQATLFLMSLFNVRLGSWLPNPAAHPELTPEQLEDPPDSVTPWVVEMTPDWFARPKALYLSDGAHFEGLGLYEMLRRRCRRIVVIDAAPDPDATFAALGEALRKARADLGTEVTLYPTGASVSAAEETAAAVAIRTLGFAVGAIRYPDSARGLMIYLKPSLLPGAPEEIASFPKMVKKFPHDATRDPDFTESQFESYRALGAWQMEQLTQTMQGQSLEELFNAAKRAKFDPTARPARPA